jgi:hypothetical protein
MEAMVELFNKARDVAIIENEVNGR